MAGIETIYQYSNFLRGANRNTKQPPTSTPAKAADNNVEIYGRLNTLYKAAIRGKANTTDFVKGSSNISSTINDKNLSRFYNMKDIKFASGRQFVGKDLGSSNTKNAQSSDFQIVDAQWVSSRFMTPTKDLGSHNISNRFFSSAGWKFSSTRLGHHVAINPRPQFTRFADIRGNHEIYFPDTSSARYYGAYKGKYTVNMLSPTGTGSSLHSSLGMGRYYSESLDDNATVVYMQFGIPKFNSLIDFFTRAITFEDSYIARHGRMPIGFTFGQIVGGFLAFRAFPILSTLTFIARRINDFVFAGPFKYYYMEPAMHVYWGTVNTIVSEIASELNILPSMMDSKAQPKINQIGMPTRVDFGLLQDWAAYLPGTINPNSGYIDIFNIATMSQQVASELEKQKKATFDEWEKNGIDKTGFVTSENIPGGALPEKVAPIFTKLSAMFRFEDLLRNLVQGDPTDDEQKNIHSFKNRIDPTTNTTKEESEYYKETEPYTDKSPEETKNESKSDKFTGTNNLSRIKKNDGEEDPMLSGFYSVTSSWFERNVVNSAKVFDAALRDGGGYAVFMVDYQGSLSDSFSNSVSDIETAGALKSLSQGARSVKFNVAGGNLVQGMTTALDAVKGFAMGALDSITMGLGNVLATAFGDGYVDLPKKWDDSSMSLPTVTYKMSLISPYGNVISQMQNIYIPLAMILAGALPLRAGESSYTSPFLCSLFNKGAQNIKMGMITSLNIERGVTNLPYNRNKKVLSVDVSFTVTDFSTMATAPINSSIFKIFSARLMDDNPFSIYLSTLCSRDLYTDKYFTHNKVKRMARMRVALEQSLNPNSFAFYMGETGGFLNRAFSIFTSERGLHSNTQHNY